MCAMNVVQNGFLATFGVIEMTNRSCMKLKEMWQGLISAFKPDYSTYKNDELHFPSEEEVAQYNKRLQDQRKAKELELAEEGVPLKESIIEYALRGGTRYQATDNWAERKQFYALKWLWDEIVEWGKQEGILLSKEEVEDDKGFTTIYVSWERI